MSQAPGVSVQHWHWKAPDGVTENGLLLRQGDSRIFLPALQLRAFADYAVDAAEHYEALEEQG